MCVHQSVLISQPGTVIRKPMSTVNTFLAMLFVLVFAIAVTSGGALKGSDAFVLRWAVLSLAVAVSVLVAWARW
jgi:hypothetical protein